MAALAVGVLSICGSVDADCQNSEPLSVTIDYNGRYVSFIKNNPDASIFYAIGNGEPSFVTADQDYVDVEGLCKIRYFAQLSDDERSEEHEYFVRYYADDTHAVIEEGGLLADAFGWSADDFSKINENFSIEGPLDFEDYAFLRSMNMIVGLNLNEVSSSDMPPGALSGMSVVSVSLPLISKSYGSSLFDGCDKLCAVTFNSNAPITDDTLNGIDNPNLLCYLSGAYVAANGTSVPECVRNVITSSPTRKTNELTLTEGYPFYCPKSFVAAKAFFVKNFTMGTPLGGCEGWETVCVPFTVGEFRHGDRVLVPFADYSDDSSGKPFWLYEPSEGEWRQTGVLKAYTPYLIAMPHNPAYPDDFNISGEVTFSARNVTIDPTEEDSGGLFNRDSRMWTNFTTLPASEKLMVVNNDWVDSHAPGSVFVRGIRDVRPFECYVTSDSAPSFMKIFDNSGVEMLPAGMGFKTWGEGNDLCILSASDRDFKVFGLNGQLVREISAVAGATLRVSGLTKGIYFIGNQKVLLTQ